MHEYTLASKEEEEEGELPRRANNIIGGVCTKETFYHILKMVANLAYTGIAFIQNGPRKKLSHINSFLNLS